VKEKKEKVKERGEKRDGEESEKRVLDFFKKDFDVAGGKKHR